MTADDTRALACKLVRFLETGEAPAGLFSEDMVCDFTPPKWHVRTRGAQAMIALRRQSHPAAGQVPVWRCDPTPGGFVLEVQERWHDQGQHWYCREMMRADVDPATGAIQQLSVYCTGDWDEALQARHSASGDAPPRA